jgi:hypothetical protein
MKGHFEIGNLSPSSYLGKDAEMKHVEHVHKLQAAGFAATRKNLQIVAYNLATFLGLKQRFSVEKQVPGQDWYKSFYTECLER